jgi:RNA polymerase sigma factor for flagellar operon FliA
MSSSTIAAPACPSDLFAAYQGYALGMARKYYHRLPRRVRASILPGEVENAALVGLRQASDRWVAGRVPFLQFAARRIRGAILDYMRDLDHLTRSHRKQLRDTNREGTCQLRSLNCPRNAMGDTYDDLFATALPHRSPSRAHDVDDAIRFTLNERERRLLTLYYDDGLTMEHVGTLLGVCESYVSQIHTDIIRRLRERLEVVP